MTTNNEQNNRMQGTPQAQAARPQARPAQGRPDAPGAQGRPQAPAKGGKKTIIIVLAVIVAAIAIWAVVWLFACNGSSLLDSTAQTGQAPYKTAEEMQAELDRTVEEGMLNISIASVIDFDNGSAPGTAYIENVPSNHYNMQVSIVDDESGDVVYESGILQPNQFIEDIVLTKSLSAGSHPATATFTALDPTTYEEVGQAAAKITLNVKN